MKILVDPAEETIWNRRFCVNQILSGKTKKSCTYLQGLGLPFQRLLEQGKNGRSVASFRQSSFDFKACQN